MADHTRLEELKRRVRQDPASIAFAALADEYRRAGLYHDAIETCRAGLQRHPAYLSARVTLGRALLEIGEYDEATGHLEQVLRAAPENLAAIRALAEIHRRRGALPASDMPSLPLPPAVIPPPRFVPPAPAVSQAPVSASTPSVPLKPAVDPAPLMAPPPAPDTRVSAATAPAAAKSRPQRSELTLVRPVNPPTLLLEDLKLLLSGISRARETLDDTSQSSDR